MTTSYTYTVADFRPAPPGWRVVYYPFNLGDPPQIKPMPGWLIIEMRRRDASPLNYEVLEREVVAAVMTEDRVEQANIDPAMQGFWKTLAPDEVAPTADDPAIGAYIERRNARWDAERAAREK